MTLIQVQDELKGFNIREGGISISNQPSDLANKEPPLRLAIIVPYRDRKTNLHLFLLYMHQFLTRQNVFYGIYLVEPEKNLKFNRAMLINIGYIESLKQTEYNWNCFVFHDVDLLPESEKNVYGCDKNFPKQMAIAVNINSYSYVQFFYILNSFRKLLIEIFNLIKC